MRRIPPPETTLANPGFEEGLSGWTVTGAAEGAVEATESAASMGSRGLALLTGPEAGKYTVRSPEVAVTPETTYTAHYWGGGGGSTPGEVQVDMVFRDAEGRELKPAPASIRKWPSIRSGGGRFFEGNLLAAGAPESAATLHLLIRPVSNKQGSSVHLDDFRIRIATEDKPAPRNADGSAPVPTQNAERIAELEREIAANPTRGKASPKIILKFDDLTPKNGAVHDRWKEVAAWASSKGIPITMGIIAQGMEKDCEAFCEWVKARHAEGGIEFWNHGWNHAEWKTEDGKTAREFMGSGYETQKKHFTDTQNVAREKLGFSFASFGAPFNSTDDDTVRVIREDPDTKVWMYGDAAKLPEKLVLERCYAVNLENPTFVPNYGAFLEGYAHNRGAEYFVLQGHPMSWNKERWEHCDRIVDFLRGQNAEFVRFVDLVK